MFVYICLIVFNLVSLISYLWPISMPICVRRISFACVAHKNNDAFFRFFFCFDVQFYALLTSYVDRRRKFRWNNSFGELREQRASDDWLRSSWLSHSIEVNFCGKMSRVLSLLHLNASIFFLLFQCFSTVLIHCNAHAHTHTHIIAIAFNACTLFVLLVCLCVCVRLCVCVCV